MEATFCSTHANRDTFKGAASDKLKRKYYNTCRNYTTKENMFLQRDTVQTKDTSSVLSSLSLWSNALFGQSSRLHAANPAVVNYESILRGHAAVQ